MKYYVTLRPVVFAMTHHDVTVPEGNILRSPGRIPRRYRRRPYSALVCVVHRCSVAFVAPHEVDLIAEGPFRSVSEF